MTLYSVHEGRLRPLDAGAGRGDDALLAVVRASADLLTGVPLFEVDRIEGSGGARLLTLDARGAVVLVRVLTRLDEGGLGQMLAEAGTAVGLSWDALSHRYPRGPGALRRDWNAWRESGPGLPAAPVRAVALALALTPGAVAAAALVPALRVVRVRALPGGLVEAAPVPDGVQVPMPDGARVPEPAGLAAAGPDRAAEPPAAEPPAAEPPAAEPPAAEPPAAPGPTARAGGRPLTPPTVATPATEAVAGAAGGPSRLEALDAALPPLPRRRDLRRPEPEPETEELVAPAALR